MHVHNLELIQTSDTLTLFGYTCGVRAECSNKGNWSNKNKMKVNFHENDFKIFRLGQISLELLEYNSRNIKCFPLSVQKLLKVSSIMIFDQIL